MKVMIAVMIISIPMAHCNTLHGRIFIVLHESVCACVCVRLRVCASACVCMLVRFWEGHVEHVGGGRGGGVAEGWEG